VRGKEGFRCSACTCTPWHEACAPFVETCPQCAQSTIVPWLGKLKAEEARFDAVQVTTESDVLNPIGNVPLEHDPGGKLLALGQQANSLYLAAQLLVNPEKKKQMRRAIKMRLQERHGWLLVRSSKFPAGDMEGVAAASLAICCYHLHLEQFHQAREWLLKARAEAPPNTMVCMVIAYNIELLQEQGMVF
jgi:hypothetical protein